MKILILGGTIFLGRHIVEKGIELGHDITLLNRNRTNPDLYPDLKKIVCDRRKDLKIPKDIVWDAVIDTSAYYPSDIDIVMKPLISRVKKYIFISTVSVYNDMFSANVHEGSELVPHENVDTSKLTHENYGALKVLCEKSLLKYLPNNSLILRPGLIVGPFDNSDRFTYWPMRIKKSRAVILPQGGKTRFQIIDARDIADFIWNNISNKTTGTFNLVGHEKGIQLKGFLNTCKRVLKSDCELVNASFKFLKENKVAQWNDMPLWIANCNESISSEKARKRGLKFIKIEKVILDTYNWRKTVKKPLIFGMKRSRELRLLKKL